MATKLADLFIRLSADPSQADAALAATAAETRKVFGTELARAVEQGSGQVATALRALAEEATKDLRAGGREAARQLTTQLINGLESRMAAVSSAIEEGLIIDPDEAAQQARIAGEEFARQLQAGLKDKVRRDLIDSSDIARLNVQLGGAGRSAGRALAKNVENESSRIARDLGIQGERGGRRFGDGLERGATPGIRGLTRAVQAFLGLEVVQFIGRQVRRGVDVLRDSLTTARDLIQSNLRLAATTRLYGVEQATLVDLVQRGRTELQLSAGVANELARNVGKLAGAAGQATRSNELYAAALDLGAANGLQAVEVAQALDNAFRAQDEGLNKLGLADPSGLYKEFAAEIGKSADALTEVEKKQAIVNGIIEAGARVQGEYSRQIQGSLGQLNAWDLRLQRARETIGGALIPVVLRLTELLEGPLSTSVRAVTHLLDLMADPLDVLIRKMEEVGVASELMLPVVLTDRLEENRRDIERLTTQIEGLRTTVTPGADIFAEVSIDRRSVDDLRAAVRELESQRNAAIVAGDTRAAGRAQNEISRINEIIAAEEQLAELRTRQGQTELALTEATSKAAVAARVAEISAELDALGAQGLNIQNQERIVALLEERKRLEEQLGRRQPVETGRDGRIGELRGQLETADSVSELRALLDVLTQERDALEAGSDLRGEYNTLIQQTQEAYEKALKAAGDTRDRLLSQAQNIRDEMEMALAGLTATAVDEAIIALDRLEAHARDVFRQLGQAFPAELEQGFAERRDAIFAAGRLEGFSAQLDSAESAAELQALLDVLTQERDALQEGSRIREQYNDLIRETEKAYQDVKKAAQDEKDAIIKAEEDKRKAAERAEQERISRLREQARTIEENVRGALQLAEAFGIIDRNTARALESVAQLASAVARIAGGDLTAIPSALGAVASLFSNAEGKRQAEQLRQSLYDLETAVLALRDAFLQDVSTNTLTRFLEQSTTARDELAAMVGDNVFPGDRARGRLLIQGGHLARRIGLVGPDATNEEARDATRRWFEEIDELFGTNLAQTLEDNKISDADLALIVETFAQLPDAIQEQIEKMGAFGSDVAGIFEQINFEFSVLGKTDAAERLRAINEAIKAAGLDAGDLQDEIDELLSIDTSTPEGRERFQAVLSDILQQMLAGADLGDFSVREMREFLQQIGGLGNAAEKTAEAMDSVAGEIFNGVRGFKTFNFELARFRAIDATDPLADVKDSVEQQTASLPDVVSKLTNPALVGPPRLDPGIRDALARLGGIAGDTNITRTENYTIGPFNAIANEEGRIDWRRELPEMLRELRRLQQLETGESSGTLTL